MSQLNISTLANLAGSETTPIADVINGSARAFVNFNGTGTVAIRASYNVSSITDNGTGNYTVNFTTAMPDINYSLSGSCQIDSFAGTVYVDGSSSSGYALTVSSVPIEVRANNGPLFDSIFVAVTINGN